MCPNIHMSIYPNISICIQISTNLYMHLDLKALFTILLSSADCRIKCLNPYEFGFEGITPKNFLRLHILDSKMCVIVYCGQRSINHLNLRKKS